MLREWRKRLIFVVAEVKLYLMILTMLNKDEDALNVVRGELGGRT